MSFGITKYALQVSRLIISLNCLNLDRYVFQWNSKNNNILKQTNLVSHLPLSTDTCGFWVTSTSVGL